MSEDYLNRIYESSCEFMEELPDRCINLTVTSPPYWNAIDYKSHINDKSANYRNRMNKNNYEEYLEFLKNCLTEIKRVHKKGTFIVFVIGTVLDNAKHYPLPFDFLDIGIDLGLEFHQDIIWHKCTAGVRRAGSVIQKPYPGYYYPNIMTEYIMILRKKGPKIYKENSERKKEDSEIEIDTIFTNDIANNIWNIAPVPPNQIEHPCPFPEEIPYRLISLYSYRGDVVLDPFAGSGTTLKVAKYLDRNFVGYDINEEYINLSRKRLGEPPLIREKQLIMDFKKVKRGEKIEPKNKYKRRYGKNILEEVKTGNLFEDD